MEEILLQKLTKIENDLSELKLLKKEVLGLAETCTYLQVSASHIYKLTSTGKIPHYCPNGKRLYFKRSELDEWLTRNPKKESKLEVERGVADYLIRNPKGKGGMSWVG
jgi:excisionase family DNA binding protein